MVLERALRDGVLVLTMNRPEQRNALNRDLFRAIGQAFVGAETDPEVRAIVLTGAGDKAFCAGMDLKAFAAGEPIGPGDGPGTTVFVERCYPKPIVAAVNGAAVAGGFGVMLGCDIIVAAEHATFGLPEVKRGLVGVGATTRASLAAPARGHARACAHRRADGRPARPALRAGEPGRARRARCSRSRLRSPSRSRRTRRLPSR